MKTCKQHEVSKTLIESTSESTHLERATGSDIGGDMMSDLSIP